MNSDKSAKFTTTVLGNAAADIRAGISAAIIGLPQDVNYGLLAAAPLGAAFAGHGIAMAVYASALTVMVTLLLGAGLGRISGPRPTICILLAGLFASLMHQPGFVPGVAPVYAALTVFLAGSALMIAASFGMGRFIKYLPVPVLFGFNNGIAAMLLISSLPLALGIGLNAGGISVWLPHIHPAALLVAAITVWFNLHPLRLLRHVPGILQALVFAWLLHRMLNGIDIFAGPLLGDLVRALPSAGELIGSFALPVFSVAMLGIALKFALAIAATAALETLATTASIDTRLCEKTQGDRELQRLGRTMICLSPLGMPVASSLGRSMSLLSAGALSRAANLYYLLSLLALALLGYRLIAQLPQAAIAGVLIVVAYQMIGHSVGLPLPGRSSKTRGRDIADFIVMVLVVCITIVDSFMTSLAVGVISAMILFIRDQSRSVVRRVQSGNHCHSLKLRSAEARAVLLDYGQEIAVIEAEGTIFFGSAESLGERIEALGENAVEIIVDLRRVSDIDVTACLLIEQVARRLNEKGGQLILSHLTPERALYAHLIARGLGGKIPPDRWFADLDGALEYAENRMLVRHGVVIDSTQPVALSRSDLAAGLTFEQLKVLEGYMNRRQASFGERLFRQGDAGSSLFVLLRGSVSIHVPQCNGHAKRLMTLGPGALLGEIGFISDTHRSADAIADEESELLELNFKCFHDLESEHPAIAVAVLRAISIALADRLRDRTEQVKELSQT